MKFVSGFYDFILAQKIFGVNKLYETFFTFVKNFFNFLLKFYLGYYIIMV